MTTPGAAAVPWACLGLVASLTAGCVGPPPPPPARDGTTSDEGSSDGDTAADESTTAVPECGNGVAEPGEACDGADLAGNACVTLGLGAGELQCSECRLDATGCGAPAGMVLVPAGPFTMGSRSSPDEQPVREVTVDAFWIDETEVTVSAYYDCVSAAVCGALPQDGAYNYGARGRGSHPINGVSWHDADAYCRWVDEGRKRLPTEAEWEKAARGTEAFTYPWGNTPADCTRVVMADADGVGGCGAGITAAVGSKPLGASPYGVVDMAGNVQEWVSDAYGDYDPAATSNPTGPEEGMYRVLRGGAWSYFTAEDMRAAARNFDLPAEREQTFGFRCARSTLVTAPP